MALPSGNEQKFRQFVNRGHSAAWEGRWKDAVDHYTQALEEFPDHPPTLNNLALAYFELGNRDKAFELYQKAESLAPEDPLPAEKIAQISNQRGNTKKAIDYSLRAADLYMRLRDGDKAVNNWTRVIRLDPENIEAHSRLANALEQLGNTSDAVMEYIALAALQQEAGLLEEARVSGQKALSLDPKNMEAQQAVEMLSKFQTLPRAARRIAATGPLRVPNAARAATQKPAIDIQQGTDPIEEARQRAIQGLADMLFDLSPGEDQPVQNKRRGLRSVAKVVADGILARGYDETDIVNHLTKALELQTEQKYSEAAAELIEAVSSGLDHPAAHFNLGLLLLQEGDPEEAQRRFQHSVKHADYAIAARLLMADHLRQQGRLEDAVVEYLYALSAADCSVLPADKARILAEEYEALINEASDANEREYRLLADNISHLLVRPDWRGALVEARGQLPATTNGARPLPVASILTQANSGRLVDSLSRINQIATQGHLRAAMEEAFSALEYSPSYLPLHIHMGELLLMNGRPQQAIEKLATVARVYTARGETDRATQMYERIVSVSPLDVNARSRLVDQLTARGQIQEAANQLLDLGDVYYRQAQLVKARQTYENALRLAQGGEVDGSWTAQILHQMADIDMQRLDWRKALRVYEQLRTLMPTDESARLNLIQLNLRIGSEARATAEMDNYIQYLASRNREADTAVFLDKVLEENPGYAMAHRRLAENHQENGRKDKAVAEWNKVGELLVKAGDREGAKSAVRAILSLNPSNVERYEQFLRKLTK